MSRRRGTGLIYRGGGGGGGGGRAGEVGAGGVDILEGGTGWKAARGRLKTAEGVLSRAVEVNPVVGLVGVDDVEAAWNRLDLSRQRAVLVYLMAVTVRPARRGRLPGGVYFDTARSEERRVGKECVSTGGSRGSR